MQYLTTCSMTFKFLWMTQTKMKNVQHSTIQLLLCHLCSRRIKNGPFSLLKILEDMNAPDYACDLVLNEREMPKEIGTHVS